MTAEEWRPVADWPHYLVSNLGRVASTHRSKGGPPKLLALVDNNGYPFVTLRGRGAKRFMAVHRMVADAFIGPRVDGLETRHLDGNSFNNVVSNLALGTHSENMLDQVEHGSHWLAKRDSCKNGHPFDGVNSFIGSQGERLCRQCARERQAAYKIRKSFAAANIRTQASAA